MSCWSKEDALEYDSVLSAPVIPSGVEESLASQKSQSCEIAWPITSSTNPRKTNPTPTGKKIPKASTFWKTLKPHLGEPIEVGNVAAPAKIRTSPTSLTTNAIQRAPHAYALFSIGAPTLLPHSVHEPS